MREILVEMLASLQPYILALVMAVISYFTFKARVWVITQIDRLKSRFTQEQLVIAEGVIKTLIKAVEQVYKNTGLENAGQAKKKEVLERAAAILASLHIEITPDALESMLESAILEGINKPVPVG